MSESVKTVIFAAVAVTAVVVAVLTYPKQEEYRPPDLVGKPLFDKFTDPSTAAELKIMRFSEGLSPFSEFEVVRNATTGLWMIPSSSNYPADADTQMREAAAALIDLKVLGVASEDPNEHKIYGVIEPDRQTMDASQEGVGLLVGVKNAKGDELARLIVGKRVKGTEDQHFVRRPGQPQVYVVKVNPDKFPTEFDKWIERNLLKISTLDVEQVTLKDYSLVTTPTLEGLRGSIDQRLEARVTWSSDQSKWVLDELVEFRNGERKPTELLPTEELSSQKLNDLKTALGDMKIVNVLRKPTGLGGDLKAGADFMNNAESRTSLMKRGFYVATGSTDILSANGELLVSLKDGVQYVLRFGEVESVGQEEGQEGKINRYLLVTARLDEAKFPPLQLDPLPGGEEAAEAAKPPEAQPADDPAAKADAQPADAQPADAQPADAQPADAQPADAQPADAQPAPEEGQKEQTDLELERERIRKENQRKQDERDEKLKKANTRIAELNARFADWYYIISEDEYKKVRLRRNDLIAEKSSAVEEGFGVDALRQLEKDGLQQKKPDDGAKIPPPTPSFGPGR